MKYPVLICDDCKLSTATYCPVCSRLYCQHKGQAVCEACQKEPRKQLDQVPVTYAGKLSCLVWRTPYGAYSSQSNRSYYTRKQAHEMRDAAIEAGLDVHLRELPRSAKWRDWYGRPCGQSWGEYELWVLDVHQIVQPRDLEMLIKSTLRDKQVAVMQQILAKPRGEWSYNEQETYHRYVGNVT